MWREVYQDRLVSEQLCCWPAHSHVPACATVCISYLGPFRGVGWCSDYTWMCHWLNACILAKTLIPADLFIYFNLTATVCINLDLHHSGYFPISACGVPSPILPIKMEARFCYSSSKLTFTFDHHVNFRPIQAELFKPKSTEQGFSVTLHHKASQSSSLLLAFNLQATHPIIVTCSPVIIHSPILALCEGICRSIQYTASVADDPAVAVSAASAVWDQWGAIWAPRSTLSVTLQGHEQQPEHLARLFIHIQHYFFRVTVFVFCVD